MFAQQTAILFNGTTGLEMTHFTCKATMIKSKIMRTKPPQKTKAKFKQQYLKNTLNLYDAQSTKCQAKISILNVLPAITPTQNCKK